MACAAACAGVLALVAPPVALGAPGDLDPTFSGDGLLTTDFGRGPSAAADVAHQADGRLVVVGTSSGGLTISRYNADGSLDNGFSGDGRHTLRELEAAGVAVQGDGKIVVVGSTAPAGGDFAVLRFNSAGSLDTTFSGDGKQTTDFGGIERGSAVALQPDGRIVVVGSVLSPVTDFAVARYNADGSLDASFSDDGRLTTDFGSAGEAARAVAQQSDGKVLVVGGSGPGASGDFAIARYTAGGSLDTAFSGDGKQTVDFTGGFDVAGGVRPQPDGRLVVAGQSGGDLGVARLNTDGSLDIGFSGDGKQTTDFGGTDAANDVLLQADGRIVAVGSTGGFSPMGDFALARYNVDGSLDASFSGDGRQTTDLGSPGDRATGAIVQGDGKVVAAGAADDFALARYNADGTLDTTFSGDGIQTTEFAGNDRAAGIVLQPDGKAVVVGSDGAGGFGLVRYNPDASLDTTFSGDGKQSTEFGAVVGLFPSGGAQAAALQPDGRVVVVGTAGVFALARYNTDGSLDSTFSGDGKQTLTAVGGPHSASDVALQNDGKIVVVGSSGNGQDFFVTRYNADGSLDTTFDGDGLQTTDFGQINEGASGVAVQPDGKIVAVGGSGLSPSDFAVARYNANGSLDTAFDGDGKQTTDFAGGIDDAEAVVLQADGKVVAAGSGALDFAVARYNPNGTLDATFDADGKQTVDFSGGQDGASAVALQSDGKLIAVGRQGVLSADFAVSRLDPSGSLDTTFSGDGKLTVDFAGGADRASDVAVQADGRIVVAGGATGETEDFALSRLEGASVADVTPPETSLTSGPADGSVTDDSTPTFGFSSSEAGSSFICRVDGGSAFPCSSPVTIAVLSDGPHSFSVAATDAAGNTDPSPASRTFVVQTASGGTPPEEPPAGQQPPGQSPGSSPITQPVSNPISTLTAVAPTAFGSSGGASASVSSSGSVRLSRPVVMCPSGPPACQVVAEATTVLPASARSSAARRTRIGRSSFSVAPGRAARIRFALNRRGLAALKRERRLRTTVRVVATRAGRRTVRTVTVTLRAPARRR